MKSRGDSLKKVLAEKSSAPEFISYLIAFWFAACGIATFIIELREKRFLLSLLFLGLFLLFLIVAIPEGRKPRNMIENDDDYLYLNYRPNTEKVKLETIVMATPRQRNSTFSFGFIYLYRCRC